MINIGGSGLRIEDFLIIFLLFLSVKSLLKTKNNFDIEYLKNLIKIYKYTSGEKFRKAGKIV
jgi:formate hydrogenlyase subunit 3/multisubunit Na+/H+ antiporter MnhD subunit